MWSKQSLIDWIELCSTALDSHVRYQCSNPVTSSFLLTTQPNRPRHVSNITSRRFLSISWASCFVN